MTTDADSQVMPLRAMLLRMAVIAAAAGAVALLCRFQWSLSSAQTTAVTVFLVIILSTLFFWTFRLAIAFLGLAALVMTKSLTLEGFRHHSSLQVIMFLVGMMVVVGVLRDLGFFTWIIQGILKMKGMTGPRFVLVTTLVSALTACAVDEVTSILFMAALIFQVCDTLKVRPTPFLIICVMATNVGSAGTMLGNPVGILIGDKAGLTFEDFIIWAFPVMLVSLTSTVGLLMFWYRKEINQLTERMVHRRRHALGLGPTVTVPYGKGLIVILGTLGLIAAHHRLERLLGLTEEANAVLYMAPLIAAGLLMIWRRERARHYIEREVEWWTLTFFLLLFAVAGTLESVGVNKEMAAGFSNLVGGRAELLTPAVLLVSALGSAFVDNVVFVAAFIPVVKQLAGSGPHPLWWALLFGACFGGNITMIGSTANIVALGMMEKRYRTRATFLEWLKVGLLTGLTACAVAWLCLLVTGPMMLRGARKPEAAIQNPEKLTGDELQVLENWFGNDSSPERAAQVGAICLRHRLTGDRVIELIGEPTNRNGARVFYYDFAPSQTMYLHFDDEETVSGAWVSGRPVRADGTLARELPGLPPGD